MLKLLQMLSMCLKKNRETSNSTANATSEAGRKTMYSPNYNNYNRKYSYQPKRPVKSFMDLEVYQKALELAVFAAKIPSPLPELPDVGKKETKVKKGRGDKGDARSTLDNIGSERPSAEVASGVGNDSESQTGPRLTSDNVGSGTAGRLIFRNMLPCALGVPHLIAEAHSLRFGDHSNSVIALEKVMLSCNKMMVYLEQVRDICQTGLPWEDFDEAVKKYIYLRRKVLNLQRSWKKFDSQKMES